MVTFKIALASQTFVPLGEFPQQHLPVVPTSQVLPDKAGKDLKRPAGAVLSHPRPLGALQDGGGLAGEEAA